MRHMASMIKPKSVKVRMSSCIPLFYLDETICQHPNHDDCSINLSCLNGPLVTQDVGFLHQMNDLKTPVFANSIQSSWYILLKCPSCWIISRVLHNSNFLKPMLNLILDILKLFISMYWHSLSRSTITPGAIITAWNGDEITNRVSIHLNEIKRSFYMDTTLRYIPLCDGNSFEVLRKVNV